MFAVIKSGGRQFKVSVGQTVEVERLPFEPGKQIEIGEVLLISDADRALIGSPYVENTTVLATVTEQKRGPKLIVFRYKPKKRFRHRRGYRQELTVLTIDDIVSEGKSLVTGEPPKAKAPASDEEVEAPETPTTEEAVQETHDEAPETGRRTRRRRSTGEASSESSTEE
jgi:large subunit ribosomal protein L21